MSVRNIQMADAITAQPAMIGSRSVARYAKSQAPASAAPHLESPKAVPCASSLRGRRARACSDFWRNAEPRRAPTIRAPEPELGNEHDERRRTEPTVS